MEEKEIEERPDTQPGWRTADETGMHLQLSGHGAAVSSRLVRRRVLLMEPTAAEPDRDIIVEPDPAGIASRALSGEIVVIGAVIPIERGVTDASAATEAIRRCWVGAPILLTSTGRSYDVSSLARALHCQSVEGVGANPNLVADFVSGCVAGAEQVRANTHELATEWRLTPTEAAITHLVALGLSRSAVRDWMRISRNTCTKHFGRVFKKSGTKNYGELLQRLVMRISSPPIDSGAL